MGMSPPGIRHIRQANGASTHCLTHGVSRGLLTGNFPQYNNSIAELSLRSPLAFPDTRPSGISGTTTATRVPVVVAVSRALSARNRAADTRRVLANWTYRKPLLERRCVMELGRYVRLWAARQFSVLGLRSGCGGHKSTGRWVSQRRRPCTDDVEGP